MGRRQSLGFMREMRGEKHLVKIGGKAEGCQSYPIKLDCLLPDNEALRASIRSHVDLRGVQDRKEAAINWREPSREPMTTSLVIPSEVYRK